MTTRTSRFVFDWWVVQKRFVYLAVFLVVLCAMAAGASLYVWKFGNPLAKVRSKVGMASGARFISFEGDVRVIRAAT